MTVSINFMIDMFLMRKVIFIAAIVAFNQAGAQPAKLQQGLLIKNGTSIRLGSITIINKRTLAVSRSGTFGVFGIEARSGDTLEFKSDNYQTAKFLVTDFTDKVVYMEPVIQLDEVIVKENSLKSEIKETQNGYRRKSVFYTGTPHYYYLLLKPMTFIYENFKSEVRDARKFNRYAKKALASQKITERFNDGVIKRAIPIDDSELDGFKSLYTPTLNQLDSWNDYDLINYIKCAYTDFFKKRKQTDY